MRFRYHAGHLTGKLYDGSRGEERNGQVVVLTQVGWQAALVAVGILSIMLLLSCDMPGSAFGQRLQQVSTLSPHQTAPF